ncbi:hypothetical protein E2C01_017092 [Portunus trituberculatus]|uniref:Uncharacterized protein n=1 Tax=Portunus trituberculatus TaxID=210409 RepID=A0A5B7DQP7_PORTR|nr:hypothetical protein [Portunus trituberculatus]
MTTESKPDGGKLGRFKKMSTRTIGCCAHRRNIKLRSENEKRESRREQKKGYCRFPQTAVLR